MLYSVLVVPEGYPSVTRPCAKCGALKPFVPADEIRINAQKKLLDVWLIHRCADCGQTWNFELFSRVTPAKLPRELYDRLLANDPALVREFAFDADLHARRGAQMCMDALAYRIEADLPPLSAFNDGDEITIECDVALNIRIGKLLREALGVSGKQLDRLLACGALQSDGLNLAKARLGRRARVRVRGFLA